MILRQREIEKVLVRYGNNQSKLGRAAGVSSNIVLALLTMRHGEGYSKEDFASADYDMRTAMIRVKSIVHRDKLTDKQKILFDFITDELNK